MQVHRSHRMERLVDVLADVIHSPAGGPLEPETILIQSKGMERWLSNQLACRLGVFANARFPFPRTFIEEVFDCVVPLADTQSPRYSREVLTFGVMALLPDLLNDPAFATIKGYLDDDLADLKRFQLAQKIAHVFDQYSVYRPHMLLKWEQGALGDWQAKLWRALSQHLGGEHFAARARRFFKEWSPLLLPPKALPRRVSVVGVSSLPPIYLKILNQVSERVDIQLFLLSPSREYFAQVRSLREVVHARRTVAPLEFDDTSLEALQGNPLLASLGRTGREFQFTLERDTLYRETDSDLYAAPEAKTLLECLQQDIVEMRDRSGETGDKHQVAAGDTSLSIVSCHSPFREVEVLRDQLLGMLEDDPSLEPSDVLVMSPSIDVYAPLIEAVFGVEPTDPLHLPFRIADRNERTDNLCAKALLQVLETVQGRMAASQVLDLLQLEPIRRRFAIQAGDLNQLQTYVHEAGIRWGIDAQHQRTFEQPDHGKNTWHFGLRRMFLGSALPSAPDELFLGTAPLDDVEGESASLVGRLAEFAQSLFWATRELDRPRPVGTWVEFIRELTRRVLSTDDSDSWQLSAVLESVAQLADDAELARFTQPIPIGPVLEQLTAHFESERVSHQFLAGGITFCAMLPMRSIPFRVVVLLGMNDGEFPRVQKSISFDLLPENPQPGDRCLKDEDRYLYLEALLSARQRLCISYVGRGVQDNRELPPSPVISELVEYIHAAFQQQGAPVRVVVEHPLQPFNPRYFNGTDASLYSFATSEALGAIALSQRCARPEPFLAQPLLPASPRLEVTLEDLIRFFQNPARAFLQNRLGVYWGDDPMLVEDREPIELGPLERYELGTSLLDRAIKQEDCSKLHGVVSAKGFLPHGTPGILVYRDIWDEAQQIAARAAPWLPPLLASSCSEEPVELRLSVEQTTLTGYLTQLFPKAQVYVQYARVKPKNEVALWVRHLALSALTTATPRPSVLFGRRLEESRPETAGIVFEPVEPPLARQLLAGLLGLYHAGHRQPLPLFPATSKAFVKHLVTQKGQQDEQKALARAREEFAPSFGSAHSESADPYVARVFSGQDPLAAGVAGVDEAGLERFDFRAVSQQLFVPMLRFSRTQDRS